MSCRVMKMINCAFGTFSSGLLGRLRCFIPIRPRAIPWIFLGIIASTLPAFAAVKTIRIAIPGQPYIVAFQVAKARGYYLQENLNVELVQMPVGVGVKATV